jgi:hypothetical protein
MDRAGAARRAQEDKVDKYLWRGVWAPRADSDYYGRSRGSERP